LTRNRSFYFFFFFASGSLPSFPPPSLFFLRCLSLPSSHRMSDFLFIQAEDSVLQTRSGVLGLFFFPLHPQSWFLSFFFPMRSSPPPPPHQNPLFKTLHFFSMSFPPVSPNYPTHFGGNYFAVGPLLQEGGAQPFPRLTPVPFRSASGFLLPPFFLQRGILLSTLKEASPPSAASFSVFLRLYVLSPPARVPFQPRQETPFLYCLIFHPFFSVLFPFSSCPFSPIISFYGSPFSRLYFCTPGTVRQGTPRL